MHADDPVLDLMDRFTAALNSHDLDAVMALVTGDIVFEATSPPPDGARQSRLVPRVRSTGLRTCNARVVSRTERAGPFGLR